MPTELSFGEKLDKAYQLSLNLIYVDDNCTLQRGGDASKHFDDDSVVDKLFGWADGLEHKYHYSRHNGQCSLQAMIDYDIEQAEKDVDADIEQFEALLKEIKGENHATTT